jgi:hypothetical protein
MLRRVGTFRTDEHGAPTKLPELDADSTFVISRDEEVPPASRFSSREEVASWINDCVLGDPRTLLLGIDGYFQNLPSTPGLGGGNFLLGAGCCMALEFLAQVYGHGDDATAATSAYVRDFMDDRYSAVFEVFWSCLRNGILHGSWPQAVAISNSQPVSIWINPSMAGAHLEPHPGAVGPSLEISSARFFADIESSFHARFRPWILERSDDLVLERAAPRLLVVNPKDRKRVAQMATIKAWT